MEQLALLGIGILIWGKIIGAALVIGAMTLIGYYFLRILENNN